jgi:hypothetical protein
MPKQREYILHNIFSFIMFGLSGNSTDKMKENPEDKENN